MKRYVEKATVLRSVKAAYEGQEEKKKKKKKEKKEKKEKRRRYKVVYVERKYERLVTLLALG